MPLRAPSRTPCAVLAALSLALVLHNTAAIDPVQILKDAIASGNHPGLEGNLTTSILQGFLLSCLCSASARPVSYTHTSHAAQQKITDPDFWENYDLPRIRTLNEYYEFLHRYLVTPPTSFNSFQDSSFFFFLHDHAPGRGWLRLL